VEQGWRIQATIHLVLGPFTSLLILKPLKAGHLGPSFSCVQPQEGSLARPFCPSLWELQGDSPRPHCSPCFQMSCRSLPCWLRSSCFLSLPGKSFPAGGTCSQQAPSVGSGNPLPCFRAWESLPLSSVFMLSPYKGQETGFLPEGMDFGLTCKF
jgi:hypothetical protein